MDENKAEAESFFKELKKRLLAELGGEKKQAVIKAIDDKAINEGHESGKEGILLKDHLIPQIKALLKEKGVITDANDGKFNWEGKEDSVREGKKIKHPSMLQTEKFFGAQPAPDFEINLPSGGVVGEVKYTASIAELNHAIGQGVFYQGIRKNGEKKYSYALVIFFNKPDKNKIEKVAGSLKDENKHEHEENFMKELWENHGVFLIIL